ncbi:hypothetical protein B0T10DRAFT_322182 [Thelonectria olida]|uniref:Uncharacterized protein n=1 Tax=Thelonectria olida TaxID=1576542 RepID=A0A9P9AMP2_9HYPO|nr:hypothetical protein B0T10DRAFT_322182 [Thelonectria olida]
MLASMLNSSQGPATIPPLDVRDEITARLQDLVEALEAHPSWSTSPPPPRNLFHVWDFVKRSHYIMTELDNIEQGRPTRHPEQIPRNAGASGANAAALSFQDVVTRSVTINEMIQNPQMLVMLGLSRIDFGDNVRERSRALAASFDKALSPSS